MLHIYIYIYDISRLRVNGEEPTRKVYSKFQKPPDVAISGKFGRVRDCKNTLSIPPFEASVIARRHSVRTFPKRDTRTGSSRNTWRFCKTVVSGTVGVVNLSLSALLAKLKAFQLPWSAGLYSIGLLLWRHISKTTILS